MYTIFESLNGRHKKFLVSDKTIPRLTLSKNARQFFKCSIEHLVICEGFIYNGLLYLENPHKRGVVGVWVAYYVR